SEPAPIVLPEIDFDTMADMVASRAADAMSKHSIDASIGDTLNGLEERITAMLQEMRHDGGEIRDVGGMQAGIDEVNERLKRLESSLTTRAPTPAGREGAPTSDIASIISEADRMPPAARPRDTMPRSPTEDAPLNAPAFPEPVPEARMPARKRHPGL